MISTQCYSQSVQRQIFYDLENICQGVPQFAWMMCCLVVSVHVRITLRVHGLDCAFWGSIDQCFGD